MAEDSGARGGYLSSLHAQLAGEDYAEHAAWENDKDRMTFKPRGSAMRNMLREEYKKGVMVTPTSTEATIRLQDTLACASCVMMTERKGVSQEILSVAILQEFHS